MNESEKSIVKEHIRSWRLLQTERMTLASISLCLGEKAVEGSDVHLMPALQAFKKRLRGAARGLCWGAPAHQEGRGGTEGLLGPRPSGGLCPGQKLSECPGLTETRPWAGKDWIEWAPHITLPPPPLADFRAGRGRGGCRLGSRPILLTPPGIPALTLPNLEPRAQHFHQWRQVS